MHTPQNWKESMSAIGRIVSGVFQHRKKSSTLVLAFVCGTGSWFLLFYRSFEFSGHFFKIERNGNVPFCGVSVPILLESGGVVLIPLPYTMIRRFIYSSTLKKFIHTYTIRKSFQILIFVNILKRSCTASSSVAKTSTTTLPSWKSTIYDYYCSCSCTGSFILLISEMKDLNSHYIFISPCFFS